MGFYFIITTSLQQLRKLPFFKPIICSLIKNKLAIKPCILTETIPVLWLHIPSQQSQSWRNLKGQDSSKNKKVRKEFPVTAANHQK